MKLDFKKSFLKDLRKIKDAKVKSRLETQLLKLEEASDLLEIRGITALVGESGYYRMRIGGYRLGLKLEADGVILVVRFLNRGEIYKYFP